MTRHPLLALLTVWIVWAFGFLLLYALQATGCRAGLDIRMIGPVSALRLLLIVATTLLLLALTVLTRRVTAGSLGSPLARITALANGAAIIAVLTFAGVAWLSLCR
ncbi:hypothetical protein [Ensifer soli]|uniref:hypothetical protein n=1 Tax=Ciceribacter sp. sgz301302 TaxID=3342379 RepID=UPI0035B87AC4